jgi:hypothetical protein
MGAYLNMCESEGTLYSVYTIVYYSGSIKPATRKRCLNVRFLYTVKAYLGTDIKNTYYLIGRAVNRHIVFYSVFSAYHWHNCSRRICSACFAVT